MDSNVSELKYTPLGIDLKDTNTTYAKVFRDINNSSKVLEIGCYAGASGEFLKNKKNCTLWGVDCDAKMLGIAKEKNVYSNLLEIDLANNFETEMINETFDYILITDVLEHLFNPDQLLNKIQPLLKENGEIIISVPNISQGEIKFRLLKNDFKYADGGLLDYTHIRFFTKDNFIKLLNDTNLAISKLEYIVHTIDNACKFSDIETFPDDIIRFIAKDEQSYIYQFYAVCKKNNATYEVLCKNNNKIAKDSKVPIGNKKFSFLNYYKKKFFKKIKFSK